MRAALAELVEVKDLKYEFQRLRSDPYYLTEADHVEAQYDQRKPVAWESARAALQPKEPTP